MTKLDPLRGFYAAESYHQDYLLNNPDQPYIVYNDLPKVRNFARVLPALYQAKPVTVADARKREKNGSGDGAERSREARSSMMTPRRNRSRRPAAR